MVWFRRRGHASIPILQSGYYARLGWLAELHSAINDRFQLHDLSSLRACLYCSVATCRHGIALVPVGTETIVDASMTIKNSAAIGASDNAGALRLFGVPYSRTSLVCVRPAACNPSLAHRQWAIPFCSITRPRAVPSSEGRLRCCRLWILLCCPVSEQLWLPELR